jgi:uncharacterized phage protein (TIGR01671 family)
MKREIKFRAWDKRKKEWVSVGFHILGETTLFGLIETYCLENREKGESSLERMNDIEITEFTGLLDRNGKEIYEGDILIPFSKGVGPMIVYYESGAFCCKHKYNRWGLLSRLFDPDIQKLYAVHIIGNVFENPELLKV